MSAHTAKSWSTSPTALIAVQSPNGKCAEAPEEPGLTDRSGDLPDFRGDFIAENPEGILFCDADLRCFRANRAACALLDTSEIGLMGQTLEEIFLHTRLAHSPTNGVETGKCVTEVFRGSLWLEVCTFWLGSHSLAVKIRDITEIKKLQSQLTEAGKTQEIGRLAGRIVHDFNNIIMIISGQTEILIESTSDVPGIRKPLEQILKAARRGAALTSRLLEFGLAG